MRATPRHFLAASFLLALVGCGGDKDPAQVACDLHFSCDCAPTNFPDVEACIVDVNAQLAALDDAAKMVASANGLTFDQECADRTRSVPDDIGCDLDRPASNECVACAIVHGDQPLGAGCTVKDVVYSDCNRDLECSNGICVDPCQRLAAGDNCVSGASLAVCDDGLFCDSGNTKQCQPVGGVGSPCPTGVGCNEDTYCGADKTCTAPPKAGEPCDPLAPQSQCDEALYCAGGTTCEPIPGDGQPCDVVCQAYLVCDAGTCKPGPGVGEPCPVEGPCGLGAICEVDTCVAEQPAVCDLKPKDPAA